MSKRQETLADIYQRDAATDRSDAAHEAELMDALKRKGERPLTMREKIDGTKDFAKVLAQPNNHAVARAFLLTSLALFTLPFIVFFLSVSVIEPMVGSSDPDTFNALAAIMTTVAVVITYVVYAFKSDALSPELDHPKLSGLQPKKKDTKKKKE